MNSTAIDARAIPPLRHKEAMRVAATEYDRLLAAVDALAIEDWSRQTVNTEWHVKAMLDHVLGTMEMLASMREQRRQFGTAAKAAKVSGNTQLDEWTALQVREHAHLSPAETAEGLRRMVPKALRGRTRPPGFLRALPIVDPGLPGEKRWKLGYLVDIILTRDVWTHRCDMAVATAQEPVITADHDGRIVADVVREWAGVHNQPFTLVLTGPAGGTFTQGDGGEHIELDAVEFCRILSGRGPASGLLTQGVPF